MFLKIVTYFKPVVVNPLSPVAPPTSMIDTYVWSFPKSIDFNVK